jgi:hypothetical protein
VTSNSALPIWVTVADAHDIVGQSFDRKVLAELSVDEFGTPQLLLPVTIRFDLLDGLFHSMSHGRSSFTDSN